MNETADLVERIESEALISDRPGQMARLEAIAAEVEQLLIDLRAARSSALLEAADAIEELNDRWMAKWLRGRAGVREFPLSPTGEYQNPVGPSVKVERER